MKGTGAKRNVCPGSCVSTGAKFPVAPVESAPIVCMTSRRCHRALNVKRDVLVTSNKIEYNSVIKLINTELNKSRAQLKQRSTIRDNEVVVS